MFRKIDPFFQSPEAATGVDYRAMGAAKLTRRSRPPRQIRKIRHTFAENEHGSAPGPAYTRNVWRPSDTAGAEDLESVNGQRER